jgi:F-type H+-transporting ATPase subunit beta
MDSTDGLSRGYEVGTGKSNSNASCRCLRTFFNVIGDAIDGLGNLPKTGENGMSIHRQAPRFEDLSTSSKFYLQVLK